MVYKVTFKTTAECAVLEYIILNSKKKNCIEALRTMTPELTRNQPYFLPSHWYGNTISMSKIEIDGENIQMYETAEPTLGYYVPAIFIEEIR